MKLHRYYLGLESLILLGAFFMEYYAHRRMGLVRHFTYTNYAYSQMPIAQIPTYLLALVPLLILLLALSRLYHWIHTGQAHQERTLVLSWGLLAVVQGVLLSLLLTPVGQATLTYPFFCLGLLIMTVIHLSFHGYYRLKCGVC